VSPASLDPAQRARLLGSKLRALVDAEWGAQPRDAADFGGGAALVDDGHVFLLIDDPAVRGLGTALAWCASRAVGTGADQQVVVLAEVAGDLARQASYFRVPPAVFAVEGRSVAPASPAPLPVAPEPAAAALAMVDVLQEADLEVSLEHGVVSGEVRGLEVARVELDESGDARIEVGVGRNDREAFRMVHGDLPAPLALAQVVEAVQKVRRPGAVSHPLNRLMSERWLRAHLLHEPSRLGRWDLTPVPGPVARTSVNDRLPAFAVGTDEAGAPVVLACSVGIDLDLVPAAADGRAMHDPEARLVLALPARDAHAVTRELAAALARPAEVLAIEGDWRQ
jgi:hypothetical protein